jgi:hypothetical protein
MVHISVSNVWVDHTILLKIHHRLWGRNNCNFAASVCITFSDCLLHSSCFHLIYVCFQEQRNKINMSRHIFNAWKNKLTESNLQSVQAKCLAYWLYDAWYKKVETCNDLTQLKGGEHCCWKFIYKTRTQGGYIGRGVPTFGYQVSLDTGKTLYSLVYFNYLLYMTPQIVCEKYVQLIVWHRPGFDLGPPLYIG